jgi:glycosyltransferase involved in cell wall biosynthesis
MRVLVVTNMWPSAERPHWGAFVKSQADSLAALGCENTLYEIHGWRHTLDYFSAMGEIPHLASSCGAELVHAHYGLSGAAATRVKLPLVVSFCGDDLLGKPDERGRLTLKSRALLPVSHHAARRADAVIVKSDEMRRAIPGIHDVEVIPNGVDLAQFAPEPRASARAALGWPEAGHVLLFAANPHERRKNWPLAEATRAALIARGLDVRLEAVFGRPQADMVRAMNAADVLLLPSFHEGSPNVVKEAMAVGLPVVAGPVGDCAERLRDVSPSWVVEHSVEAFANAAAAVLADARRSNGRDVIARTLSLEAVAKRVLAVYERARERFAVRHGAPRARTPDRSAAPPGGTSDRSATPEPKGEGS